MITILFSHLLNSLAFVQNQDEVHKRGRGPSLALAIIKAYGFDFFVVGFYKLGQDLLAFSGPLILKYLKI